MSDFGLTEAVRSESDRALLDLLALDERRGGE